ATIEYDPNRSARIALLAYADGEKRYILQPDGLKVGQKVVSGPEADILVGNALPLKNIPPGPTIHTLELKPGKGAQMVRSAGGAAQLVAKEGEYALVKLPSGETRKVAQDCMATIGQVGNLDHENVTIGKAGRMRWLGRRPVNRGVSMNPVDHPHGGARARRPAVGTRSHLGVSLPPCITVRNSFRCTSPKIWWVTNWVSSVSPASSRGTR